MKSPFNKETTIYKSSGFLTPYQKAKQEWDSRIGNARVQAKNWRLLAIFSLLISGLLLAVLLIILATRRDHLYVAEITKEGRVINVAPLLVRYQPTAAQKEYFLAHFIQLTRSIPLDPVLAKKNWLTAYNFLSKRGAERLNYHFKQNNPTALLGKKTVTVQISYINPITLNTMDLHWTETTVNSNGEEEAKKSYGGIFTIEIKQPAAQEEILRNPLGVYIVDFNIVSKGSTKG